MDFAWLVLFIYIFNGYMEFCWLCVVIKLFKSYCAGSSNQKDSLKQIHIKNDETVLVGEAFL